MVSFSTSDEGVRVLEDILQYSSAKVGMFHPGYKPVALLLLWTFGYSLYCSNSWSQPIWMYSGLHSRCVWHPWSAHSTGIHLDTTDHCQECVLWLFQHLQIHSVFVTWVQSHGNACWCHYCVPVTMETDGQLPDTSDLWWGKCESLLIFVKFLPFASDWLNDWLV